MADELIWMEGLLDVEQAGVVERAQREFVTRPFVGAVRVDRQRYCAARHADPRGADRSLVPTGRDFDLDAPIAALQRLVHPLRQHVGPPLRRDGGDAEGDAAFDGTRWRHSEP